MVEFGLKLEDNKVSEWSEHYIDYEGLKKILKKAKKAQQKYKETCAEDPQEAKAVTKAYRSGAYDDLRRVSSTHELPSPTKPGTGKAIENLEAIPLEGREKFRVDEDEETGNVSERSSLLKYQGPTESSRSKGIVGALSNMLSTGSLANSFERKVRKSLEEIDNQVAAFDNLFYKEQIKVVSFYYTKFSELQSGFEFIVEKVLRDQGVRANTSHHDTDDEADGNDGAFSGNRGSTSVSPFPTHRKRDSSVGEKFEELIMSLTDSVRSMGNANENGRVPGRGAARRGSIFDMGKIFKVKMTATNIYGEADEDEDEPNWDHEDVVKAETVRRDFIDQYRENKLLQNYAMMNVTGFVKIIKKFDKSVPSKKGRFKKALENQCMLNDARANEVLSNKFEKFYANWFCNGDTREAKAQMLVKRGDGLDMDWSQLQLGYRMGMCAILAVWVCWDMVWGMIKNGETTIGARYAFPVFRACGGLLLLQWFWGCSVFMWTRYRVNYTFLFDFDPRIVRTPMEIFKDAVDNTLTYLCLMLVSNSNKNDLEISQYAKQQIFSSLSFFK